VRAGPEKKTIHDMEFIPLGDTFRQKKDGKDELDLYKLPDYIVSRDEWEKAGPKPPAGYPGSHRYSLVAWSISQKSSEVVIERFASTYDHTVKFVANVMNFKITSKDEHSIKYTLVFMAVDNKCYRRKYSQSSRDEGFYLETTIHREEVEPLRHCPDSFIVVDRSRVRVSYWVKSTWKKLRKIKVNCAR
jgi:hypothetical protein